MVTINTVGGGDDLYGDAGDYSDYIYDDDAGDYNYHIYMMTMFTVKTVGGRKRSRGFCGSLSFLHQLGELWGKMIVRMITLIMRMVMIVRARMMTRMAMVFVAFELGFDFRRVKRNKAAQKFRITLTLQMLAHTDAA